MRQQKAAKENLTRDGVAALRKRPEAGKGKASPRVTLALGAARSVTLTGPGLSTLDQLIEWIEELLQRAKKARPRGVELQTFSALLRDEAKAKGRAS